MTDRQDDREQDATGLSAFEPEEAGAELPASESSEREAASGPAAGTAPAAMLAAEASDGRAQNLLSGEPASAAEPPRIDFIPRITIGFFVETPEVRAALERAAADRRMSRAAAVFEEGGLEGAVGHFSGIASPDLIIAETGLAGERLFKALEALAELVPPTTRLILVGRANDVTLYRRLLRFGVGDYLVAPLDPLAVVEAVAQLFQEDDATSKGKVTLFLGARGGAGSSAVAVNTAAAMASHCDTSVLLVDLDLHFGTAALDLDMEPTQGVRDALEETDRLDETLLDRLVTRRDERIGLLAAPARLGPVDEPDGEAIAHLIDTARGVTPHLLLDMPRGWSGWTHSCLLAADEIVLTATPDLAALRNARNITALTKDARVNDPAPRLVLNQVRMPKRQEVKPEDFARVLGIEPTVTIPFDAAAFGAAATRGELVAETRSNTEAATAFEALAAILTGRRQAEKQGAASALLRLLGKRK